MNKEQQKKLLSKWVNVSQIIEGVDKQTYIVLKPNNENEILPDVKPMGKPVDLDYSIYPKTEHNKINEAGFNEAPTFGPSKNNPPVTSMFDKKYDLNGPEFIKPDKRWEGIIRLGEVDGVDIFYDQYHPDQTLTVELNKDKTEMIYIIGPYDDITIYDGIRKNIIVSEKPITLERKIKL